MLLAEAGRKRLDSKHHGPDSTQHPRTHTNDRPRISRIRRRSRRRGSAGPDSSAGGAIGRSGLRGRASDRDDGGAGPRAGARGSSCTSRTDGGRHARSGSHARSRGLNTGARGGEGGSGGVCECGSGNTRAADDGRGACVGSGGLGDSTGTGTSLARSSPGMISTEIQNGLSETAKGYEQRVMWLRYGNWTYSPV